MAAQQDISEFLARIHQWVDVCVAQAFSIAWLDSKLDDLSFELPVSMAENGRRTPEDKLNTVQEDG
eukprot:10031072-Ditylum_brightwellii.AAC.1